MVLLTMTPSIVEGLQQVPKPELQSTTAVGVDNDVSPPEQKAGEPSLEDPELGNPISHDQILQLWKQLKTSSKHKEYSLEHLLRGAQVYVPPPPPKPEPSAEYKALMARLRREEEARSYERMVNPAARLETFQERFPYSAQAFAEVNKPTSAADIGDDDVSYTEVHRQVTLIINFLVSIAGVAGTLWVASRWWSVTSRIFLTMGGSILVAIAEVVVYSGYMWRLEEAKKKQDAVKESKEVVETWIVGKDGEQDEQTVLLKEKQEDVGETMRKRRTDRKEET